MKTKDSQKSNFVALAKAIVLILAVLVLGTQAADASYMKNVPQTLTQPDGTTLKCFATGDEFYHWLHDANNFTIIQDTVTGFFVYATKSEGKLAPTTLIAGKSNPAKAKLMAGINIEPEQVIGLTKTMFSVPSFKGSSSVNTIGTINNIVIFVRFNDQAEYTDQLSKYDQAFNSTSTPSMLQFFEEVSGPHVTLVPEKVIANDCVDIVCVGEGEGALIDLVENLDSVKKLKIKRIQTDFIVNKRKLIFSSVFFKC